MLWGCISLFVRALDAAGLSSMEITDVRMVVGTLGMLLVLLVVDPSKLRIRLRDLWLFIGTGVVSVTLFNVCYFTCISLSEASIAVVLLYTSPVFVIILARIFFKEKITRNKFIALVLTIIGCVFVTGVLGEGYMPPPAAILTGVLTGLAYALNNILTSAAVKRNDPITVTFYTLFFSFVFLIPFSGWNSLTSLCRSNPMILVVAFVMCLVTAVFAQYFFSLGLGLIESGKAAIYGATEPIVGSLVGILLFHEESNLMKIAGIIMVIAAILLIGKSDAEQEGDNR